MLLTKRSLAVCCVLFYCELVLFEVYAVPLPSSDAKVSKLPEKKNSKRIQILPDPAEILVIPDVSESNAEAILLDLGYNEIDQDEDNIRTKVKSGVRKWSKNVLTYNIDSFPAGKRTAPIQAMLKKAFNEWSKVTNLDFAEVDDGVEADIEIIFGGRLHRKRGGWCTFDESSRLAHAFFPEVGDIHFHSKYFFNDPNVTLEDFLNTAMHEIGHSLGLDHSRSKASLMHPTESTRFTEPQPIDIMNIQELYGARRGGRAMNNEAPKLYSLEKIDATIQESDGNLYPRQPFGPYNS